MVQFHYKLQMGCMCETLLGYLGCTFLCHRAMDPLFAWEITLNRDRAHFPFANIHSSLQPFFLTVSSYCVCQQAPVGLHISSHTCCNSCAQQVQRRNRSLILARHKDAECNLNLFVKFLNIFIGEVIARGAFYCLLATTWRWRTLFNLFLNGFHDQISNLKERRNQNQF